MADDYRARTCLVTGILLSVSAVLATIPNILLLLVTMKNPLRRLRVPSTGFIVGLAVADLVTGALGATSFAYHEIKWCYCRHVYDRPVFREDFSITLLSVTINCGIHIVTALSIERFFAVVFPNFYRVSFTLRKTCVCTFCIYCFSVIFHIIPSSVFPPNLFSTVDMIINIIIPLVILILSYTIVYFKLRRQRRTLFPQSSATNRPRHLAIERRISKVAFYIVLSLILSFIPYLTVTGIESLCTNCVNTSWFFITWRLTVPIALVNAVCDPILCFAMLRSYGKSLKSLFMH